jgi:diguanylate cyclase (GGDEF)-like protein
MLEAERIGNQSVSLRIGEQAFEVEEETGYATVPKEFLTGFRLSDIPSDISIKPVERIEGNTIHVESDVTLSQFTDGSATATVEEMFRREFWDGDLGLSPYVAALRQAVDEDDETSETHFDDDGDYIFLHFDVKIAEDLEIQKATRFVDATIERIHERADQLAHRRRDGLLGIFDRGSFEHDLAYALRGKQRLTLVMVDIDHFKQVNDTLGHQVGDDVLRTVTKVLTNKCDGRSRVPYRYGGEELSLILAGNEAAKGTEIAESIRADVERLRFQGHADLRATVSLGVAEAGEKRNSAELISRADAALYLAKKEGRNRVRKGER